MTMPLKPLRLGLSGVVVFLLMTGAGAKAEDAVKSTPRTLPGGDSTTPAVEFNKSRHGEDIPTAPGITVYLQGQGIVPQVVLRVGKVTATEIFRQAGVRVEWSRNPRGKRPGPPGMEGPITSAAPPAVRKVLLTFVTGPDQGSVNGPLASSRPYARDGVQVMVFYHRVQVILDRLPAAAGKIFGHVLAHEIGHALQGISRHSETGVMKANWSAEDIYEISAGPLTFSPRDIELIHAGVALRQAGAGAGAQDEAESALRALFGGESGTAAFDFDKSRPQPVPTWFRAMARRRAPRQDWIKRPTETQRRKLDAVQAILRAHERESVYEIRLYHNPEAYVQAQNRAVVLISTAALSLLSAAELQALLAHELGHEYVWDKFQEALKRRDNRRRRELELFCDGIAILTLRRAGVDPVSLLTALEKVTRFNRVYFTHMLMGTNADTHPSLGERKRFAAMVLTRVTTQVRELR